MWAVESQSCQEAMSWSQASQTEVQLAVSGAHLNTGMVLPLGSFEYVASVGPLRLKSAGRSDIFLARLSPSLTHVLWAVRYGSTADDTAQVGWARSSIGQGPTSLQAGRYKWLQAVVPGVDGSMLITGSFGGTVRFGLVGDRVALGKADAFVAKAWSRDGLIDWAFVTGADGEAW
jgi:hypothetical protein